MGLFNLLKQAMLMNNDTRMRVGLSQFKKSNSEQETVTSNNFSIRTKDVKLSDLMRRTSSY